MVHRGAPFPPQYRTFTKHILGFLLQNTTLTTQREQNSENKRLFGVSPYFIHLQPNWKLTDESRSWKCCMSRGAGQYIPITNSFMPFQFSNNTSPTFFVIRCANTHTHTHTHTHLLIKRHTVISRLKPVEFPQSLIWNDALAPHFILNYFIKNIYLWVGEIFLMCA